MDKKLTASYLDSLYNHADSLDQHVFDRFLSYGRLTSGDHFYQQIRRKYQNIRSMDEKFPKSRLRLVQNHISRFVNAWSNAILDLAPDVDILPDNPREEKDKKAAQLNRSVKAHIVEESDFYSLQEELVKDYISLGEAIIKISFDPTQGTLVPGEQRPALDTQTNQVVMLQDMMPSGKLMFTHIEPENLLRDPVAKSWLEARWVCHRHMLDKKRVVALIESLHKDDPDRARELVNSLQDIDETKSIYKGTDNMYSNEEENKKVLIREFFWRPTHAGQKGKYCMATRGTIIHSSELPFGIFPFEFVNFESNHGTPRGESRIKQLAPIQLEINRCVSKIAEHQITLGDDKLITTAGSKVAEVNKYEGIRLFQVTGGTVPEILPGRSGTQYLEHLLNQVSTFDQIGEIFQVSDDKMATLDPYAMSYLSSKQKKKYAKHASKFERFLIRLWKKTLKIHKLSVHPQALIPLIGAAEKMNIDEYKSSDDLCYQVKIKTRTEDPESLIAKQFQINQFLQYGSMDEADLGVLAKESPFLDKSDLALKSILKSERAQNMILKLDKGIDFPVSQGDDPSYMLQRLDTRMSQPDFDQIIHRMQNGMVVPTEIIHQLYKKKRQEYLQIITQQQQEQQRLQQGMIPSSGRLIPVQMYDAKVNQDGSIGSKRVMIPNDALEHTIEALKSQGMLESSLQGYDPNTQAEIANQLTNKSTQPGQDQMNIASVSEGGEI